MQQALPDGACIDTFPGSDPSPGLEPLVLLHDRTSLMMICLSGLVLKLRDICLVVDVRTAPSACHGFGGPTVLLLLLPRAVCVAPRCILFTTNRNRARRCGKRTIYAACSD